MGQRKAGDDVRIVSFGWTAAALLAEKKTVTRREWSYWYARSFHKGDLLAAYDRSPRYKGKQIATIRLTCNPYEENVGSAPAEDYEAEGMAYLKSQGIKMRGVAADVFWRAWQIANPRVWVVRFELVSKS